MDDGITIVPRQRNKTLTAKDEIIQQRRQITAIDNFVRWNSDRLDHNDKWELGLVSHLRSN